MRQRHMQISSTVHMAVGDRKTVFESKRAVGESEKLLD